MTMQIKESGPQHVERPFRPTVEARNKLSTDERQTEALEHIAVSLSAIDHNVERLTNLFEGFYKVWAQNSTRR